MATEPPAVLGYYQAAYDFNAENENELTLRVGDVIQVYAMEGEWFEGELPDGRFGLFPANHVIEYTEETGTSPGPTSSSPISGNQVQMTWEQPPPQYNGGHTQQQQQQQQKLLSQQASFQPVVEMKGAPPVNPASRPKALSRADVLVKKSEVVKPVGATKFGIWGTYMGYICGVFAFILGIGDMIWGGELSKYGLLYILIGIYSFLYGLITIAYEYTWGQSRSGDKIPWRAIVYFFTHIPMYLAIPTIFGAVFYTAKVVIEVFAAINGEEYEANESRTDLKQGDDAPRRPYNDLFDQAWSWILLKKEQNQLGTVIFLFLYAASNIIIFFYALAVWIDKNDNFPPNERLSGWAPFAKAFGNILDWNCSIIVLPVCRTVIRYLYNISTHDQGCIAKILRAILSIVPLDRNLEFHKIVAKACAIGAIGHTVFHLINYIKSPDHTLDKFGTVPWWTGGIIFFAMFFIYSSAAPAVKNGQFELFWYSHHCFIAYFLFLLVHGAGGWNPNFWKWFIGPGTIYLAERIMRIIRANQHVVLLSVTNMRPNVVALEFAKDQGGFWADPYYDGQYVFIKCPTLSKWEWHPFTISSAPEQPTVTLHIRKCGKGSWTQNLAEYLCSFGASRASRFELSRIGPGGVALKGKITGPNGLPLIECDGPHSAPTQHVTEYHTVMVVGGGIGVTPVAATMKSVVLHRWRFGMGQCFPDNAYFYWVCAQHEVESFRWFIHSIKECEDEMFDKRAKNAKDMNQKRFEFHVFVTSVPKGTKPEIATIPDTDDIYSFWGLPNYEVELERARNIEVERVRAPFSALELLSFMRCPDASQWVQPNHSHLIPQQGVFIPQDNSYVLLGQDIYIWNGRPNWDQRYQAVSTAHPKGDIGVAFCGNPYIAADLEKMCHKWSSLEDERIFRLHKENF